MKQSQSRLVQSDLFFIFQSTYTSLVSKKFHTLPTMSKHDKKRKFPVSECSILTESSVVEDTTRRYGCRVPVLTIIALGVLIIITIGLVIMNTRPKKNQGLQQCGALQTKYDQVSKELKACQTTNQHLLRLTVPPAYTEQV